MQLPYHPQIREYPFGGELIRLYVPDQAEVQLGFANRSGDHDLYWTRVWPSAEALCSFLTDRPWLMRGKEVWELGAGLGMPSLLAARFATRVVASDRNELASGYMRASAGLNDAGNLVTMQIDWNELPPVTARLVLLSDVNYEPDSFAGVYSMIENLVDDGVTVVVASPARITSSAFFEKVVHLVAEQAVITRGAVPVAIWRLCKNIPDGKPG